MAQKVSWGDAAYVRENGKDRYGENVDIGEFWLRFEGRSGAGNQYKIRFLGEPLKFATHFNNKTDPLTKERTRVLFPDSDNNKKVKRNCTDGETTMANEKSQKCPWCRLGYDVTPRFMVNVAYYGRLDSEGDPRIMMAELPVSAWNILRKWTMIKEDTCPGGPGSL